MSTTSILFEPGAIATLANEHAIYDLDLFLFSIQLWNKTIPPIYLYCTEAVKVWVEKAYPGMCTCSVVLEQYKFITRAEMERLPSKKDLPNLFYDFTQEKCSLMGWAMDCLPESERTRGVLFCDSDIAWLGPLPKIPEGKLLALSPHMIRKNDEAKYGLYNAGFLWTADPTMPAKWEKACTTSRFFEQAALEEVASLTKEEAIICFGQEHNYGWWRLFQSPTSLEKQQAQWTIRRDSEEQHSGLLVQEKPVSSIHTHFKTNDVTTNEFNKFVIGKLRIVKSQTNVKKLLKKLGVL